MTQTEALRLALQELELEEAQTHYPSRALVNAITAIKAALEAKDEPVAWYRNEDGIRIYYESKVWDDVIPLYTTPPQRALDISNNVSQRLLLTDEPIGNAIDAWFKRNSDGTYGTWRERMRAAIKAAHGIKGEA